jgi:hypothetical protein
MRAACCCQNFPLPHIDHVVQNELYVCILDNSHVHVSTIVYQNFPISNSRRCQRHKRSARLQLYTSDLHLSKSHAQLNEAKTNEPTSQPTDCTDDYIHYMAYLLSSSADSSGAVRRRAPLQRKARILARRPCGRLPAIFVSRLITSVVDLQCDI